MNIELIQAAQDAAEAIDWLLKNIQLNAPHLSGKAMGNAEKCASALRTAIQQAKVNEPVWFHKHWGKDDDIFYRPNDVIPDGSTPLYATPQPATASACNIPGMAKTTCPYCEQGFSFEYTK